MQNHYTLFNCLEVFYHNTCTDKTINSFAIVGKCKNIQIVCAANLHSQIFHTYTDKSDICSIIFVCGVWADVCVAYF